MPVHTLCMSISYRWAGTQTAAASFGLLQVTTVVWWECHVCEPCTANPLRKFFSMENAKLQHCWVKNLKKVALRCHSLMLAISFPVWWEHFWDRRLCTCLLLCLSESCIKLLQDLMCRTAFVLSYNKAVMGQCVAQREKLYNVMVNFIYHNWNVWFWSTHLCWISVKDVRACISLYSSMQQSRHVFSFRK